MKVVAVAISQGMRGVRVVIMEAALVRKGSHAQTKVQWSARRRTRRTLAIQTWRMILPAWLRFISVLGGGIRKKNKVFGAETSTQ